MALHHSDQRHDFALGKMGLAIAMAVVLFILALAYLVVPAGTWNAMMGRTF